MNRQIGPYILEQERGRGRQAVVYRGFQPTLQRTVAIKIMAVWPADDPTYLARFRREARAVASLHHPHLVTIYDIGEEEGAPYLVMEYLDGGSLADRLRQGALGVAEAVRIISQIAGALDYVHAQGFVHGNIKPANILLSADGQRAVLSDLGIVRPAIVPESATPDTGHSWLDAVSFQSPEQQRGEVLDGRSDLYALARVLYVALWGERLAISDDQTGQGAREGGETSPAHAENPAVPPELAAVLRQALAEDRRERFQTGAAFRAALEAAQSAGSGGALLPMPVTAETVADESLGPEEDHEELASRLSRRRGEADPTLGVRVPTMPLVSQSASYPPTAADPTLGVRVPTMPPPVVVRVRPMQAHTPRQPPRWINLLWAAALSALVALGFCGFVIWQFSRTDLRPTPVASGIDESELTAVARREAATALAATALAALPTFPPVTPALGTPTSGGFGPPPPVSPPNATPPPAGIVPVNPQSPPRGPGVPVPSPAAASGTVLLNETFVDNRNGWPVDPAYASLEGGHYRLRGGAGTVGFMALVNGRVSDLVLEAEMQRLTGPVTGTYGLVARAVPNTGGLLWLVSEDGRYTLQRWTTQRLDAEVLATGIVTLNPGGVNVLRLVVRGQQIAMQANGLLVAQVIDSQPAAVSATAFGLWAGPGVEIAVTRVQAIAP